MIKDYNLSKYYDILDILASTSKCDKYKTGALLIKNDSLIGSGINDMLPDEYDSREEQYYLCPGCGSQMDISYIKTHEMINGKYRFSCNNNECDCRMELSDEFIRTLPFHTKKETIHAEENAINKALGNNTNVEDSSLLTTIAPCIKSATLIIKTGVSEVYYRDEYKNDHGTKLLVENNVKVIKFKKVDENDN